MFSRKYCVRGIHFHAVTASESYSEPQSYRKSHEKAPNMTENRNTEGLVPLCTWNPQIFTQHTLFPSTKSRKVRRGV